MADRIACLTHGKVELLLRGQRAGRLESPYLEQLARGRTGRQARIVRVTRGRTGAELCYAIFTGQAWGVFVQVPGTRQEQRLFQIDDAELSDLDFSREDQALACTVAGLRGSSAIALLADDGKGVRTVTEGDVVDRAPRWAPGGRREIVYASAGIGRTKSGAWAGLAPSALHRLRFAERTVEVLIADAKYDYSSPVPISESALYALRRAYRGAAPAAALSQILGIFGRRARGFASPARAASAGDELVSITARGTECVQASVAAYDVAESGDVIYSNDVGVFRITAGRSGQPEALADLDHVEQIVIY
jgi:hypothetical protein